MNSSARALFLWQHFDTWLSFVIRYPYMSEHTRNETGGILDVRDGHALRCSPWSTRPPERQKLRERLPLGVTKERNVLAVINAALVAWLAHEGSVRTFSKVVALFAIYLLLVLLGIVSPEPLKELIELFRN